MSNKIYKRDKYVLTETVEINKMDIILQMEKIAM